MNNINFKQLEAFVTVADCHSFTEAAGRLFLAQSTISSHIKALELELGVTLFQRESKKNITLTPDGHRIYQYASDILSKCTAMSSELANDTARLLTLGASTTPAEGMLPGILAGFLKTHPDCCCTLKGGDSTEIHRQLMDGEIQIGFVGSADNRQSFAYEKIAEDRLVMITPNNTHYRSLRAVGLTGLKLLGEPMIFREMGSATQKRIDNYLSEKNINPKTIHVVAYLSTPEPLKELVIQGAGVSIISELLIKEEERAGKLLVFPLEDKPVGRNIYMVYRKKGQPSELADDFIKHVRSL